MFTIVLLIFSGTKNPDFFALRGTTSAGLYSFYVTGSVPIMEENIVINNAGLGNIVRCDINASQRVKNKLKGIVGESVTFEGNIKKVFDCLRFYHASIVKTEHLEGEIYSVYASSNAFQNSIIIDNKKINLQICFSKGIITIGSPIILGDY